MTDYDNLNSGVLFKNNRKEREVQPDYKGEIDVQGVVCWLSAWIKTSGKGEKFMSLSATPKDSAQSVNRDSQSEPAVDTDDIPF